VKKAVQAQCKLDSLETEELQELCLSLDAEQLEELSSSLEALPKGAKSEAFVRSEIAKDKSRKASQEEDQARQREEAKKREAQKAAAEKEAAAAGAKESWSTEELGVLAKGLQKFPGGMGGRWALITKFLNDMGYERAEKEVVEMTKELSDGKSLRAMGQKVSVENSYQAPVAKAAPKAKAAAAPAAEMAATEKFQPAQRTEPATEDKEQDPSIWSAEQQAALEKALARHPASLEKNERWKLIAADVHGKTKGQCVERFKFLREQLTKAKS